MRQLILKGLCATAWLLTLAACGGGGAASGGSDTVVVDSPRQPQATVVRDDNPTAARMALGPADFLPTTEDGQWVFDRLDANGVRVGSTTLSSTPSGNTLRIAQAEDGGTPGISNLRLDASGWMAPGISNTSALPASAQAIVGEISPYANPFHAIGSVRVQFRSGNFGADLDGDGVNESFEYEFRQTMVGFETVAGPNGPIEALHLRNETLFSVIPSKLINTTKRSSVETHVWLARGLGYVRETLRSVSPDGTVDRNFTRPLVSVRIGGVDPLDINAIHNIQALDIVNRDLVFDAARSRYYASVPGSVLGQGNRIAVIDATSGAVSYSAVLGSEPGAMALAADGASLYAALDGSSELLRLALPGLTEIGRMRLPADPWYGALVTEALAASPADPAVVALSLAYTGVSPRHAGVLLARNLQAMPQRTAGHTGSNAIVFGADGQWLYGMNNETTEFGLRRIEVLADGLVERQVLGNAVGQFYLQSIDRTAAGLVLGNRLYAQGTLAPMGQISGAVECRALANQHLACVTSNYDNAFNLLVADAGNSTLLASLHAPTDSQASRRILVAGPPGRLAVRDRIDHPAQRQASRILLLQHAALQ